MLLSLSVLFMYILMGVFYLCTTDGCNGMLLSLSVLFMYILMGVMVCC